MMNEDQELKEKERATRAASTANLPTSATESTTLLDQRITSQLVDQDVSAADMVTEEKIGAAVPKAAVELESPVHFEKALFGAVEDKEPSGTIQVGPPHRIMPSAEDVFNYKNLTVARETLGKNHQKDIHVEIAELETEGTEKSSGDLTRAERDASFKSRILNPVDASGGSLSSFSNCHDNPDTAVNRQLIVEPRPRPGIIDANAQEDPVRKKIAKDKSGAQSNQEQVLRGSNPMMLSGTEALRELDERIAYKTGIVIENQESETKTPLVVGDEKVEPDDFSTEKYNKGGYLTKSPGIPVDSARTFFKEVHDPSGTRGSLSALEDKLDGIMSDSGPLPEGFPYDDVEMAAANPANKLAVAVAVKEDEDDKFIPAAVEYDPDSKPPIFRNRRFRLYSLLACTLIAVMIAGVVGLLTQKTKEPVSELDTPTTPPTREGSDGIVEQLELIVGSEVLNDPQGPHYRAKEWLINVDPLQLSPVDANLVQRYLLAVVYFKLHEDGDWVSCNAPTEEDPDDFCLYQQLINIFPREYRSVAWYRWLSGNHECSWAGLFCDEFMQLRTIDLLGQELSGALPVEFTYFPFLQAITLAWNNLRGSLPPEYGSMPHLLNLEVHYNQLTGTIPLEFTRAKNLQLFNIAANAISGSFPDGFFGMKNLKGLFVFENLMSGSFPSELGQLSLLTYSRFQRNFFTGTIPTELGLLNPRELWMYRMPLEGSIPSEIGNIEDVLDLRLHATSISGTIPEQLWQLTKLWRLDLFNTQLSGTLSQSIARLSDLVYLRVRNAGMTGTLPASLTNMTELSRVWLEGNDFVGSVPEGMCDNPSLDELVADCASSSDTNEPKILCSCCHSCCDHTTGLCDEMV